MSFVRVGGWPLMGWRERVDERIGTCCNILQRANSWSWRAVG